MLCRSAVIAVVFGAFLMGAARCHAQGRAHVMLPHTTGATYASTIIDAQARYNAAAGDYLESVAIARLLHAEASVKESAAISAAIDVRRRWLEYYFERRILKEEYRKKLNPSVNERTKKKDAMIKDLIINDPAILMQNNLITTMNWMLVQLATYREVQDLLFSNTGSDEFKDVDLPLSPYDLASLQLCLVERVDGQQVVFLADRGSSLTSSLPLSLRQDGFKGERLEFEELKQRIAKDAEDGVIEYATLTDAGYVFERFREALDREFPFEDRKAHPSVFFEYRSGLKFLLVQEAAIRLAVESNSAYGLNGDCAFQGDSLFQLLNHMVGNGMHFAKPPKGQRHVYEKAYLAMRNLYMRCDP